MGTKHGGVSAPRGSKETFQGRSDAAPVYYPTKAEFSRQFASWVREKFRKNPDLAMFRVVPPPGWCPRQGKMPDLR